MNPVDKNALSAWQTQLAIKEVLLHAASQDSAEKGAVAAALSIMIATRGPMATVDYLRDLSDKVERDAVLPNEQVSQWLN